MYYPSQFNFLFYCPFKISIFKQILSKNEIDIKGDF